MRLFIAFEIPENIRPVLSSVQDKLIFSGKATKTREFHLTLKFLGEVDESKAPALVDALSKVHFNRFEASLSRVGAFPSMNDPRVVWVGLEPHDVISAVQQQVDACTQKLGFGLDKRFHPHLTLARIKFVDNKKELKDCIESIKVPEASFALDSFKLIKSTLTPQGPVYEVLGVFKAQD
ncbi:RNA 2',3'-cyclic phosphodiesterase [Candidatus Woesearchaeota archaeon]|nr:RNA 2',3'-cyclic phosphodiesterase [Candidatus Woesearchaeota archaeon]